MTQALYLDDAYLKEWKARILSIKDGKYVVLDRTAFYPKGGGQPCDLGVMHCNGKEYKVVFVGKFEGIISHEIDCCNNEPLKEGDTVECRIDWNRRYKLMRMHTACHVLAGIIHKETGAMITGNQLDIDKSRIDFSVDTYDPEKMNEYIEKANTILKEGHDNKIYYVDKSQDIDKFLRLAKGLPEGISNVRIVEIVGFDAQPDGGTHVHNTTEVGSLRFLKSENKGKSNRRVYFELIDTK